MDPGVDAGVPWIQGQAPVYTGAFRDNIRAFLKEYGTPVVDLGLPLVSCWNVELRSQQSDVRLQVYEERLHDQSPSFCDPCRIIGEFLNHTPRVKHRFTQLAHACQGLLQLELWSSFNRCAQSHPGFAPLLVLMAI